MAAELWQAAVLGVVQGLTEFLPVSSTGHLILVPAVLGWPEGLVTRLAFDVALHIGTLGALLGVFWRDWAVLIVAALRTLRSRSLADREARLALLLALATGPAVVAGVLFESQAETLLRSPVVVGTAMFGVGLILGIVDRLASLKRDEYSLGPAAALAVGVGQALALIPGVSRSGGTIAVGLATGLTRSAAARFSFLLSTPTIVGAVAKQSVDVGQSGIGPSEVGVYAVGIVTSAVSGYAAIRWLLAYLRRRSLLPFVIYRVLVGSAVIVLAAAGRL
ncbi:MAG: UDP-diphosphatase [Chloroflexi bacterium]|nr:UDP-diphosphatase [Chloroflexota bacterium]